MPIYPHLLQPPHPCLGWRPATGRRQCRTSTPAPASPSTPAPSSTPGAPTLARPELRRPTPGRPHSLPACASVPCSCGRTLVHCRGQLSSSSGANSTPPLELHPNTGEPHLPRRWTSFAPPRVPRDAPMPPSPVLTRLRGKSGPRPGSGPTLCRRAEGSYNFWLLLSLLASLSGFPMTLVPKLSDE
jgi:hypothetical protein